MISTLKEDEGGAQWESLQSQILLELPSERNFNLRTFIFRIVQICCQRNNGLLVVFLAPREQRDLNLSLDKFRTGKGSRGAQNERETLVLR